MLQAIPYDALLAAHLLAVATFLAGLVLLVALLPGLSRAPLTDDRQEGLRRLRLLDRVMTRPALLLLWLCGIGMTLQAGWYVTGWLRLKIVCVVLLTVLHAERARRVAALIRTQVARPAGYRLLWPILLLVVAIGILVIAKPL